MVACKGDYSYWHDISLQPFMSLNYEQKVCRKVEANKYAYPRLLSTEVV